MTVLGSTVESEAGGVMDDMVEPEVVERDGVGAVSDISCDVRVCGLTTGLTLRSVCGEETVSKVSTENALGSYLSIVKRYLAVSNYLLNTQLSAARA